MKNELNAQYLGVGKVMVAFSNFEMQLNSFIGFFINNDMRIGQMVTSELHSTTVRINLLFSLFKNFASDPNQFGYPLNKEGFEKRDELVTELIEIKNKCQYITEQRNKIVHSWWFQQLLDKEKYGDQAPMIGLKIGIEISKTISGGKTGLKYDVISTTSSTELTKLEKEILEATNDLVVFRNKIESLLTNDC